MFCYSWRGNIGWFKVLTGLYQDGLKLNISQNSNYHYKCIEQATCSQCIWLYLVQRNDFPRLSQLNASFSVSKPSDTSNYIRLNSYESKVCVYDCFILHWSPYWTHVTNHTLYEANNMRPCCLVRAATCRPHISLSSSLMCVKCEITAWLGLAVMTGFWKETLHRINTAIDHTSPPPLCSEAFSLSGNPFLFLPTSPLSDLIW